MSVSMNVVWRIMTCSGVGRHFLQWPHGHVRYQEQDIDSVYVMETKYWPYIGADFVLMDDNSSPHCARVVTECIDREGIERTEWPAKSADLTP